MVKEGQVLDVELLGSKVGDKVKLETLAIVDGDKSEFGTPLLKQQTEVEIVDANYQGTKVVSIRFKAKKRVDVKRGHRQRYTCLLYTSPSPRDRTRSRMPSSA